MGVAEAKGAFSDDVSGGSGRLSKTRPNYASTFDDSSGYAGRLQSIHQHICLLQFNCKLLY